MNFLFCLLAFLVAHGRLLTADAVEAEYRKQEFLDMHNYLRGSVYPPAKNMLKLKWSDRLAELAKKSSEKCLFRHLNTNGHLQNLYSWWHNNVTKIVMYYFMERAVYDPANPYRVPVVKWGHYVNMVRSGTEYVGCAITKSRCGRRNGYYSYCNYDGRTDYDNPPGQIYAIGKPCTMCPHDRPFCQNNLCVASPKEGTCKIVCQHCGQFDDQACACSCTFAYLKFPDCSAKRREPDVPCPGCTYDPPSRQPCVNGGQGRPSNCSICDCPPGFSGQYCEYKDDELENGVMVKFHWTSISNGYYSAYFPMTLDQGNTILRIIKPIIINAVHTRCSETINPTDIVVAKGYPLIDRKGLLRIVLLIKGFPCFTESSSGRSSDEVFYMPQEDVLNILRSVREEISAASVACCGTPLDDVKLPSTT